MTNHYKNIAEEFNDVWEFSIDYKKWAVDKISKYLQLNKEDIFVDVGGGTGMFTDMIQQKNQMKKAYCIEPEKSMCAIAEKYTSFKTICGDAFYFITTLKYPYSKILFKEVIHHINNRALLWKNIYNSVQPHGRILIYTRPQNIKFPLFNKAKDRFKQNQPAYELLVDELQACGFSVNINIESFTFKIPKEKWFHMLHSRFMSDLSSFTDQEIDEGISEIKKYYGNPEVYTLTDEIVFLSAYK